MTFEDWMYSAFALAMLSGFIGVGLAFLGAGIWCVRAALMWRKK